VLGQVPNVQWLRCPVPCWQHYTANNELFVSDTHSVNAESGCQQVAKPTEERSLDTPTRPLATAAEDLSQCGFHQASHPYAVCDQSPNLSCYATGKKICGYVAVVPALPFKPSHVGPLVRLSFCLDPFAVKAGVVNLDCNACVVSSDP
jgi:hypothetical protein